MPSSGSTASTNPWELRTDDEERQHRFYESMGYRDTGAVTSADLHTFVQITGLGPDPDRAQA